MAAPQMPPKEASDRTEQVTFKVIPEWIERAEKIAKSLSAPPAITETTKTEVLRAALGRGLDVIEEEIRNAHKRKR